MILAYGEDRVGVERSKVGVRKVGSCVYLDRIVIDFIYIYISLRCVSLDFGIIKFKDIRNLLGYMKFIRIWEIC